MKAENGKIEFTVAPADLEQALAIVKQKCGGNCIIGTKTTGGEVLVQVMGFSLSTGESSQLQQTLREQANIENYAEGIADAEIDF